MTIKELKKYLKNFKDSDTVVFNLWTGEGDQYFVMNAPACKPITFQSAGVDGLCAVVGHADDCMAHRVTRLWNVQQDNEPEVKTCPECGTPNQFGQLCHRCEG